VSAGCSCTLLTITSAMLRRDRQRLNHMGVDILETAPDSTTIIGRSIRLLGTLLRLSTGARFDVVYTNATGLSPWLVWKVLGRRGNRVIHHHHTSADENEKASWSVLYPLALRLVPELVACSETVGARLSAFRGERPINVLHYLTPDLGDVDSEPRPARKPGALVFAFFGRVIRTKGIDWILSISSEPEFRDARFQIHGTGPDYRAEDFDPYHNVEFLGPYEGVAEHARRLTGVDCVLLPSLHVEGAPLVLLEAMSSGKPWIATNQGGVKDLAVCGDDSLVTEPTIEAFRRAVLLMQERLLAGHVSETSIRKAYDGHFGLRRREEAWLSFFGLTRPIAQFADGVSLEDAER
jgi:glycosyltransferase involved in cell wall biosynthesis